MSIAVRRRLQVADKSNIKRSNDHKNWLVNRQLVSKKLVNKKLVNNKLVSKKLVNKNNATQPAGTELDNRVIEV